PHAQVHPLLQRRAGQPRLLDPDHARRGRAVRPRHRSAGDAERRARSRLRGRARGDEGAHRPAAGRVRGRPLRGPGHPAPGVADRLRRAPRSEPAPRVEPAPGGTQHPAQNGLLRSIPWLRVTKKARNTSITSAPPIFVSGPAGDMLRPFFGATIRSGPSRSYSTVTVCPVRSSMPTSLRSGLVRTTGPRSVVNSIVSTIVELRLFLPLEMRTLAEITVPRACWPPEVMRAPRT